MQNNESGLVAMTQGDEVRTLHMNVLPLIGASVAFLQLQPQSPFQTHYKTMVTSLIAACVYMVTGLASIKFNGFIKEMITEVSFLSGLLSPLLMFLTMFPPLGWVCLVLWALSVFIQAYRMISSRHHILSQQDNQLRSRQSDNDEDKHEDHPEAPEAEPEKIREEKPKEKPQNERQDMEQERKPKEVELPRGNASVSDQTSATRGRDDDDHDDEDEDDTESSERKQPKEQQEREEKVKAMRLRRRRSSLKSKVLRLLKFPKKPFPNKTQALHTCIVCLICNSATTFRPQPQSPFQTHYKTMVTSLIAACVFVVTGIAHIKFNGFIKEVITKVSLLSGLLSSLLMFLAMCPPFGWACLVLWALLAFITANRMISSRHLKPSQQDNQLRSRPSDNDEDKHEDDPEALEAEPEKIREEKPKEKPQNEQQEREEAVDMMEKRLGDVEVPGKQWRGTAKRRVLHGKKTG